jgi:hypothetical protein
MDWKTFGDAIRAFYGLNGKGNGTAKREQQSTKTEPKNDPQTVGAQEKPDRTQQPEPQNGSETRY